MINLYLNERRVEDVTILELAHMVRDIVYPSATIEYDLSKPDGTPRKLLDVTKLKELGWGPKIGLGLGIEETYRWYLSQTQEQLRGTTGVQV